MSHEHLPKHEMKLGSFQYEAGITRTASATNGIDGGFRADLDITYAGGQKRAVAQFVTKGALAKHTKGLKPTGPNKVDISAASGLSEAVFYATYPQTSKRWRFLGSLAEAERNGLPVMTGLPQRFTNSALTGLGKHETLLRVTFYEKSIRATKPGYDAGSPNSEGWDMVGEAEIPADVVSAELDAALAE